MMFAIFDQEEVEAIDRRNFRKGITAENREKTKNVIMLVRKGKISLDEIPLFFPQLSGSSVKGIAVQALNFWIVQSSMFLLSIVDHFALLLEAAEGPTKEMM